MPLELLYLLVALKSDLPPLLSPKMETLLFLLKAFILSAFWVQGKMEQQGSFVQLCRRHSRDVEHRAPPTLSLL